MMANGMAEQPVKEEKPGRRIGFKRVQLFKDQILGIGSYGAVCKAKFDDLLCAAKILHPTLFDPTAQHQIIPQREHRLPSGRFELECEFLNAIRHPNIIQYLGMGQDPATNRSVLLMELMDGTLTHFLESSTQPIPYHIQVNICHDITLALSFLHSNNIVHRDLSSNNVLMISNVRAKLADFGMARFGALCPQATGLTSSMCPGTDVYMPPEAVQDKPVYAEKIDCFSFGVIIIQILTRQFPEPGERRQKVEIHHSGLPQGTLEVHLTEVDRRQNHICLVSPGHSLLPVALDCLKDTDVERPSARQLCEQVTAMKESREYSESLRALSEGSVTKQKSSTEGNGEVRWLRQQVRDFQQIIESQASGLVEKDQRIALAELENQQLRQEVRERDYRIGHMSQLLESSEQVMAEFGRQIAELGQLEQRYQPQAQRQEARNTKWLSDTNLRWRKGKNVPCPKRRCDTAILKNKVSILHRLCSCTLKYYKSWFKLPVPDYRCTPAVSYIWL